MSREGEWRAWKRGVARLGDRRRGTAQDLSSIACGPPSSSGSWVSPPSVHGVALTGDLSSSCPAGLEPRTP